MTRETRGEEIRQERRLRKGADTGVSKRLFADESKLDRDTYEYHWAKEDPGRIAALEARDWDRTDITKLSGTGTNGAPLHSVLMRKRKDWDKDDRAEKQRLNDDKEAAMLKSKALEGGESKSAYTPDGRQPTRVTAR